MAFYTKVRAGKSNNLVEVLPGVETKQQIEAEQQLRIKALGKAKNNLSRELGEILKSCSATNPCNSGACSYCFHQFRKWSFAELKFLSKQFQVQIMTVLFYSEMMNDKELFKFDFSTLFMRFRKQLDRSGFSCPVIGYLEFDYHTENNLWLPHFHLMVLGNATEAIQYFRRQYCIKEKRTVGASISRPLLVTQLKDPDKQLSYLCKGYSSKIKVYRDQQGKRRTVKSRLLQRQLVLSLRVLNQLGFSGRLFLYKARRMGHEIRVAAVNEKMG